MSLGGFFKGLGKVALVVATHVVPIIATVDAVAAQLPGMKGPDKKQVALNILGTTLPLAEELSGVDLKDAEIAAAVGACIDAEVAAKRAYEALEALVAKKKG